jgi:2-amino-4-hydroxy-6-hydroxymethyldihydropteridine diphosphokinase
LLQIKTVTAYVGLGSNLGNGQAILLAAWETLGRVEGVALGKLSSPYLTEPVGMTSRHWFTNAVGRLQTWLEPTALLRALLTVEAAFGRRRTPDSSGYEDRSLDLDLLYYATHLVETAELVLPHPRIAERLFVLAPLAELASELRDNRTGQTVAEMVETLRARLSAGGDTQQDIQRGSWRKAATSAGLAVESTAWGEKRL